jgi:hypothetical protein
MRTLASDSAPTPWAIFLWVMWDGVGGHRNHGQDAHHHRHDHQLDQGHATLAFHSYLLSA